MSYVRIVNVIPADHSDEINNHWNPCLTVNPANPNELVIDSIMNVGSYNVGPIFFSGDGGETWQMIFGAPSGVGDQSVGLASSGELYQAISLLATVSSFGQVVHLNNPTMYVLRTANPAVAAPPPQFDLQTGIDQPYLHAFTQSAPSSLPLKDTLYLGYNMPLSVPQTARIDVCLNAKAASPVFMWVTLDPRVNLHVSDSYEIRPTAHASGRIYVAYKGWRKDKRQAAGHKVIADVVVARDDQWGGGGIPRLDRPR